MISFAITFFGFLAATLIPIFVALYLVTNLKSVPIQYMAAAGLGLVFWFFYDTMGGASALEVNLGFGGGAAQIGVIVVFLAGIVALAIFDYIAVPSPKGSDGVQNFVVSSHSKAIFLIPVGLAVVMGFHGFGEGWDFGSAASSVSATSVLDALGGGYYALISYLLHKFLEAVIIAGVYSAFVGRTQNAAKAKWHLPLLGIIFGGQSIIGSSIGYFVGFDTTYFFAFGVTSTFYAAIRLGEPLSMKFRVGENAPHYLGPKIFVALAIGFLLLYIAALFHS